MLPFHLKALVIAALAGLVTRLVLGGFFETFLVVLLALLIAVAIGFARRKATAYTITDRRLNVRRGLISREIQETRLDRIGNVSYRQGPLQRLLRIGDIDFETSSSDNGYNFVFAGVADPASVVHKWPQKRSRPPTGKDNEGAGRDQT